MNLSCSFAKVGVTLGETETTGFLEVAIVFLFSMVGFCNIH
jgi:hypothetical protein